MFTAITNDPKLLRDCIETIAQLIDDAQFKLKKDGIELTSADRAMVAFVDFKIKSTAFEKYDCEKDQTIGLNLLNFLTVLKRAGPDDKMTLDLKENKLDILLQGQSSRRFAIPLLELQKEEQLSVENLRFDSSVELNSEILEQGINDTDIVADSAIIELDKGFKIYAEGNSNKAELRLDEGNQALINLNAKSPIKARVQIRWSGIMPYCFPD